MGCVNNTYPYSSDLAKITAYLILLSLVRLGPSGVGVFFFLINNLIITIRVRHSCMLSPFSKHYSTPWLCGHGTKLAMELIFSCMFQDVGPQKVMFLIINCYWKAKYPLCVPKCLLLILNLIHDDRKRAFLTFTLYDISSKLSCLSRYI